MCDRMIVGMYEGPTALYLTRNPNASQWNIGCFGSQTQISHVGHVHFFFLVLISFALGTQFQGHAVSCPGGSCPGGSCPGESCPGGSCLGGFRFEGILPGGILAGGILSGGGFVRGILS